MCSGGMNGYMVISDKPVQPAQIYSPIEGMEIISNNEVLYVMLAELVDYFQFYFSVISDESYSPSSIDPFSTRTLLSMPTFQDHRREYTCLARYNFIFFFRNSDDLSKL